MCPQIGRDSGTYLVNVQLLPGWYMIELRVNGQAAMVRAA